MRELQFLLAKRDTAITIDFDHLNRRVRCYAHVINICSSHIVASATPGSKTSRSDPEIPVPMCTIHAYDADSNDESDDGEDDGDIESNYDSDDLDLNDDGDAKLKERSTGIKRNPLGRARRLVRFLRSSDGRKEDFCKLVHDGNNGGLFTAKGNDGKHVTVQVPNLELLRDVKTRWDTVYLMLRRLRQLRPVSCLTDWTVEAVTECFTGR